MLSSIPPPSLEPAHNLWYPSLSPLSHTFTNNSQNAHTNQSQTSAQQSQSHRQSRHSGFPPQRTVLSVLRADENAITNRRANIRKFGAGWLKPPGVSKTLQGMWDEQAEREEAEAAALREAALAEAHAAQEALAATDALARGVGGEDDDDEEGLDDRDLDDDIPDADADAELDDTGEWVDSENVSEEGLPLHEGDGDYGDDDLQGHTLENSALSMEGVMGRNLDEDVPEAGSYQHTDTEVEDDSSSDGEVGVFRGMAGRRSATARVSAGSAFASGSSPMTGPRARGPRRG